MASYMKYKGSSPLGGVVCLLGMQPYDYKHGGKISYTQRSIWGRTPLFLYTG